MLNITAIYRTEKLCAHDLEAVSGENDLPAELVLIEALSGEEKLM